ncbi:hypothetical protein QQS21_012303 [Conoideocrella luteorostrata]|uniref:Cytochrome P450 n=1 Tax=Conoideocrella luteorostrata TaxID=1105319 RepID=A0AAJ0CBF8_9HYPO|nr:hypothetical protein QQS21_012303 [Conoideocrella luteorostrata]
MAFATTRIVIPEAQTINWTAIMWRIALCFVCHGIWLAIYRLFFSSLSAFPGPKIAAATAWYEFYYDVIKQGRYFYRISEMHEKYGPVIRINPWELSIRDGAFYSTLYVSGSTRRSQIFPRSRAGIGIDGSENTGIKFAHSSHAVSEDHDLHRVRRKPLDQFFSRRRVQSYEHDIIEELKLLEDRFFAIRGTRTIINMEHVYAAITGDIIGKISVMTSPSLVSDPAFSPDWHSTLSKFFAQISLYTQFTFLVGWVRYIPRSVLLFLTPGAAGFKSFTDTVVDHIKEAKKCTHDAQLTKQSTRYTLIEHLLASEMPEAEKMTARLTGELIAILAGGTMTTARALSTITYFALADPCIGAQLRESVSQAMKGFPGVTPRLVELERVAYLTACVKEGLRWAAYIQ